MLSRIKSLKPYQIGLSLFVVLVLIVVSGWFLFSHSSPSKRQTNTGNTRHDPISTSSALRGSSGSPKQNIFGNDVSDLSSCQGTEVFSASPAVEGTYASIEPLGHSSSYNGNAGHVMPVDHLYFNFRHTQANNLQSPTLAATVVAPGNIEIFQIANSSFSVNGKSTGNDYELSYGPCKEVNGYLGHINTLSEVIQNALNTASKKICADPYTTGPGSPTYQTCNYTVNLKLKAGDSIGTAGGPGVQTQAFDFGTYDSRNAPLPFIDQKYWTANNLHAVCGLSYYPEGEVKVTLFSRLETTKLDEKGRKDCGTNMWDQAGTSQGNWVLPNTPTGPIPDNENGLSVIHLNIDPSQGSIDWGGTIAPADRIAFKIAESGFVNRDPKSVTADGNLYCFQDVTGGSAYAHGVVLQLIDSNTLKVEYHKGLCPSSLKFVTPTTYVR